MQNPIVKDVARLMRTLRNADTETLEAARSLAGAGECCLADSDLVEAVIPVVDVWIENAEEP